MRPIVLASASPRRKELLREIVPDFEVVVAPVDEEALTVPDPWETAERLALAKARAAFALRPEALVIGGDTVVAYQPPSEEGYVQLAKPADAADAIRMLRALAGREHIVATGIALISADGESTFVETTKVRFRPLGDDEIANYVATEEPLDKAGAYGLQGGAAAFVEDLEGSRSNVIGLPLEALRERLEAQGSRHEGANLPL
ncbi:MAG: Maf family protein [Fimbriimonas sp.]